MTNKEKRHTPAFIAHRGYAARFPENSLEGIRAALEAGIRHVEFDVQVTHDRVPVLLHDHILDRVGRYSPEATDPAIEMPENGVLEITDIPSEFLKNVYIGEPERFGDQYKEARIPTLRQVVEVLKEHPKSFAFVEIKNHSLERFKLRRVVEAIIAELEPIKERMAVISIMTTVLKHAKECGVKQTGWVVGDGDVQARMIAEMVEPNYLFGSVRKMPIDRELWSGPWKWAMYEIPDVETAERWLNLGAQYLESFNAPGLKEQFAHSEAA